MDYIGTGLQYAYYLRFHILIAAVWLTVVYWSGNGKMLAPMLGGIFCLSPRRLAGASAAATFLLFSSLATADLIFSYGPNRFSVSKLGGALQLSFVQLEFGTLVFSLLPGLAWLVTHVRLLQASGGRLALAACTGSTLATLLAVGALAAKDHVPYLDYMARLSLSWTPKGYFDASAPGGALYPGHRAAMAVLLLSVFLYLAAGWWTGKIIKSRKKYWSGEAPDLPICTLVWILGLLLLGSWTFGALTFLGDAFPSSALFNLIILVGLASCFAGLVLKVEPHTYRGIPVTSPTRAPAPEDLLARAPLKKAIIVCASGGGIHAGAWAAAVLDALCKQIPAFRKHVVLTSSVSGGSVGCFYFLASYGKEDATIFPLAASSSLDYAAWGYAFRDLVRYFFPLGDVFHWGNRSWAIERAWRRFQDLDSHGEEPLEALLHDWQEDAANGSRPGCVFNTTIVETGERFPISTVDFGPAGKSFLQLYPKHSVRAATAANLSAAFPYVSPAARIWTHPDDPPIEEEKSFHLVDGGYYDNYGILSAVQFIDMGFTNLQADHPDVLVLRIEGHPEEKARPMPKAGFRFQAGAPLNTMFTMRSESQVARNELELKLLAGKWSSILAKPAPIRELRFSYPLADAPLSWHLTRKQKEEIAAAVKAAQFIDATENVKLFLGK